MISTKIQTTVTIENHRAAEGGDVTASIDTDEPDRTQLPEEDAEDFPEAVVDGVAQVLRQAEGARLDSRLRGGGRAHLRRHAGVGVVGDGGHPRGPRDTALHVHDRGDVRRQRHLSPGDVEVGHRTQVDEACRPLDDLPVHRGQLHAVRGAGPAVVRRQAAAVDRLGSGLRGRAAEDVLALVAPLGRRAAVHRCWAGSPRGSSCRSCTARASRRWSC